MALNDIDIAKPATAAADAPVTRTAHPAARFLPLLATLLLALAIGANVYALQTPSWLKTTSFPTLFNVDGKVEPGVNGTVLTRVGPSEMCFFLTNATPPAHDRTYCVVYDAIDSDHYGSALSACAFVDSNEALAAAGMRRSDTEAEFIRLVCGGLGDTTIFLHVGAIAVAGVAVLALWLSCLSYSRIGKVLRIASVVASVLSGVLAISTYTVWLVKLSTSDMRHGKSSVLTVGSVFLLAGAALASSSGLERYEQPTASASDAKEDPEADALPLATEA